MHVSKGKRMLSDHLRQGTRGMDALRCCRGAGCRGSLFGRPQAGNIAVFQPAHAADDCLRLRPGENGAGGCPPALHCARSAELLPCLFRTERLRLLAPQINTATHFTRRIRRDHPPAGGGAGAAAHAHVHSCTIQYDMMGALGASPAGDFDTVTKCETIPVNARVQQSLLERKGLAFDWPHA